VQGTGPVAAELQAYPQRRADGEQWRLDRPIALTERLRLRRFGFVGNPIPSGGPASFEVDLESTTDTRIYELAVLIHDALNRRIGLIDFRRPEGPMQIRAGQTLKLTAHLAALPLVEGHYQLGASIRSENEHPIKDDLARLDVTAAEHAAFVPYQPSIRGLGQPSTTPSRAAEPSVVWPIPAHHGETLRWYLKSARHPLKNYRRPLLEVLLCLRVWVRCDGDAIRVRLGDYVQRRIF
jgi:hypothetical protein